MLKCEITRDRPNGKCRTPPLHTICRACVVCFGWRRGQEALALRYSFVVRRGILLCVLRNTRPQGPPYSPACREKRSKKKRYAGTVCACASRKEGLALFPFLDAAEKPHDAGKLSPPNLVFAIESIIPEKSETRAPCLFIIPTVFVNQLSWRIWIADERPGTGEHEPAKKKTRVQNVVACNNSARVSACPCCPFLARALRCPWLMLQVVPFLVMTGAGVCHGYSRARGEIRRPCEDHRRLTHVATPRPPIKNESVGIEDDQIPS